MSCEKGGVDYGEIARIHEREAGLFRGAIVPRRRWEKEQKDSVGVTTKDAEQSEGERKPPQRKSS